MASKSLVFTYVLHVRGHEAQTGLVWVLLFAGLGQASVRSERQVLHLVDVAHPGGLTWPSSHADPCRSQQSE